MKKIIASIALYLGLVIAAHAQTGAACKYIAPNAVLTAAQWNFCFQQKQDGLGYVPVNKNGDVMLGELVTAPSGTVAGLNIAPGTLPGTLHNGDVWITAFGVFAEVNGVPVQLAGINTGNTWTVAQTFAANVAITGSSFTMSGNISAPAWTTNGVRYVNVPGTVTDTTSTGTVAAAYTDVFGGSTVAASSAVTFTNYYALYAKNPVAGTNATLTSLWALGADSARINGPLLATGSVITNTTTAATSAVGQTGMLGTLAAALTLSNNGQAFFYNESTIGAVVQGAGSADDITILNKNGATILTVPTGTTVPQLPGLAAGTCSSMLALDASNNVIKVACAVSTVAVGSTSVTGGTNGQCLYSNGGTLGSRSCVTEPQGRLTLAANTPVMINSGSCSGQCTAQTTLRYDCYMGGGQVPYYDGTQIQIDTISSCEVTDALVSAASAGQVVSGNVYDVYWVHGGANRICLPMSASTGGGGGWSADTGGSNTARGSGYSALPVRSATVPFPTNPGSIANCFNGATNYGPVAANQGTYLGTVFASANGQISFTFGTAASGGGAAVLGVWNYYNRITVVTAVVDSGASYTYNSATIRQSRGSATNQVQWVTGVQEDGFITDYNTESQNTTVSGTFMAICIGLDTTSTCTSPRFGWFSWSSAANNTGMAAHLGGAPQIGLHAVSANERGDANSNTFDNNNTGTLSFSTRM